MGNLTTFILSFCLIIFAYPRVEVIEHRQKNLENKKHILKQKVEHPQFT